MLLLTHHKHKWTSSAYSYLRMQILPCGHSQTIDVHHFLLLLYSNLFGVYIIMCFGVSLLLFLCRTIEGTLWSWLLSPWQWEQLFLLVSPSPVSPPLYISFKSGAQPTSVHVGLNSAANQNRHPLSANLANVHLISASLLLLLEEIIIYDFFCSLGAAVGYAVVLYCKYRQRRTGSWTPKHFERNSNPQRTSFKRITESESTSNSENQSSAENSPSHSLSDVERALHPNSTVDTLSFQWNED